MCYFAPLFLLAIAYVYGALIKAIIRDNDAGIVKTCIIGTFFVLISFDVFLFFFDAMGMGFRLLSLSYSLFLLVLFVMALFIVRKKIIQKTNLEKQLSPYPVISIGSVVFVCFVCFCIFNPDITGDASVETVNTVLSTDSLFGFNCYTGNVRYTPVSLNDKLNVLPYLYTYLTDIFNCKASTLVYRSIPLWTLSLSLMVFALWADLFFEKDTKKSGYVYAFICGVGVLALCGTFSENSIYYYLILKGFSPLSFIFWIVIPFNIYELYITFKYKKWSNIVYILMTGLSAAAVASVQRGLIPFLISSALCILVILGYRIRRALR